MGETVKTYDYSKTWSSFLIDSSNFRSPEGHGNPTFFPYEELVLQQENITAGKFLLPEEVIDKINWFQPLVQSDWNISLISDTNIIEATDVLNSRQGYFISSNEVSTENSPVVGDSRIKFSTVESRIISVVASQKGNKIARWQARDSDGSILLFKEGNFTADEMFVQAEAENQATTWLFRFLGFFLMAFGIYLILNPIQVFADVIPFLGDIVGVGIRIVAFILAMFFSGLTISIAWLVNHPIIGGLMLLGFVLLSGGIYYFLKQRKDSAGDSENETAPGKLEQPEEPDAEVGEMTEAEPDNPIVDAEAVEEEVQV